MDLVLVIVAVVATIALYGIRDTLVDISDTLNSINNNSVDLLDALTVPVEDDAAPDTRPVDSIFIDIKKAQ
jgi:hypothetical protein